MVENHDALFQAAVFHVDGGTRVHTADFLRKRPRWEQRGGSPPGSGCSGGNRGGGKTGGVRTLPLPASASDQWAGVLTPYLQNGTIYLPVKISDGQTPSRILFFSSADLGETWVYEEAMNRSADTL